MHFCGYATQRRQCASKHVNLSRALFFFKHLNTRYNSNCPPDKYQVILTPPKCPISLNLKNVFTRGNHWLGGICSSLRREPKITWGEQELMQRSCFSLNRTEKCTLYWTGNQVAAPPLTSSSCELRLLTSLRRSSPSPQHWLGPGAIYQRKVIQEKTNLLICFSN